METYFPVEVISVSDPKLQLQIARIFLQANNLNLYNHYLTHASNRSDSSVEIQYQIGDLLLNESKQYEIALYHFLTNTEAYPNIFEFVYGASIAFSHLGKVPQGIELLENWMLTHPNNQKAQEWLEILKTQI